jgi:hypothetical protein
MHSPTQHTHLHAQAVAKTMVGNTAAASGAPHNIDEALAMFLGSGFVCPQASTYAAMNVGSALLCCARACCCCCCENQMWV